MKNELLLNSTAGPETELADALAAAGEGLGSALARYNTRTAVEDAPDEATAMVHAFHAMLTLALPYAPVDLLESMIELCVMETARARLECQAENGTLPGARILAVGR